MALAEAGRFEEALALQRSLIQQAEEKGDTAVLPRLGENLGRYERAEACCGGGSEDRSGERRNPPGGVP